MKRIFGDFVYSEGPRAECWWTQTCDVPDGLELDASLTCDVAIIGGGFTGLNAALTLAKSGVDVVLLEAETMGWGASGRNGGFCCLGGAKIKDDALDRKFGVQGRLDWHQTEALAIDQVAQFLEQTGTNADVHSNGETWLAHREKDMRDIEAQARRSEENYGVPVEVYQKSDLVAQGLNAGFFGGMTIPVGFGLNPRKYLAGLICAAQSAGARLYDRAWVTELVQKGRLWHLKSGHHTITAEQVIVATNGYSSETVPRWLAGRYMPGQSNVAVTRPLSDQELDAQGWTSSQMCYDSRNLLHYFRLMSDRRMLFGMRGGLGGSPVSERRARARLNHDFRAMFPAWSHVDLTHHWSGMVCLARNKLPFVGPVPGQPGLFCAMCYHGNGVAMGSYAGGLVAELALGEPARLYPQAMKQPFKQFPLGAARRALLPVVYAGLMLADL